MSTLDTRYRLTSLHAPSVSLTHSVWCHQALRGAMKDPSLAVDPTLTIEYQKLFTAASRYREVFAFRASSSHNAAMLMCIACPLSNTCLLSTQSRFL